MKYTSLLIDIDDTLLDFLKCERHGFLKTCEEFNLKNGEEIYPTYSQINDNCWKELEKGLLNRAQVTVTRFERLFKHFNLPLSAEDFNNSYKQNLSKFSFQIDGAEDLLKTLSKHYQIYAVTNGTKYAQDRRIKSSGLKDYFNGIFISEVLGLSKPDKRFYDYVVDNIQEKDRQKMLIIGDSLSSDIQGGINSGIDTCWYNPHGKTAPRDMNITHTVKNFNELLNILL
jgi:YjjG family noncanonical pyrimidine nucleotidase